MVATLDRSDAIAGSDVRDALESIAPAGCALVASGNLDRVVLTVIAEPLRLTIGTISGELAFKALDDENLNDVPGASTAEAWTIYLPATGGLAPLVNEVVDGVAGVATSPPPPETTDRAASSVPTIDLRLLDPQQR